MPFRVKPFQCKPLGNPPTSGLAFDVLVKEAEGLVSKSAVKEVVSVPGEFISSYFSVPKLRSPGKFRPILNLKAFKNFIKHYKFKLEGMKQVRQWIQKDSWFCGIDLKDMFLHCPIHVDFRK